MIELSLPWPPTVNSYWQHSGQRAWISKKGVAFRKEVLFKCAFVEKGLKERLSIAIYAHPPDRRRRDIDNILKSLLDALEHASVYLDDSQIDVLYVKRMQIKKFGEVRVKIKTLS